MRLYIDADVWLNFWQDEMLGLIPASHYAEELLDKALRMKWIIVISGVVKEEILKKKIALADLEEKLDRLRQVNLLEEIEAEKEDVELSKRIIRERGLHFPDSLHAALAIRAKAIIVTRTKHFELVKNLVEVRKPEDLL
ncbi:MAG: PIN domain-containing protein [Methanobacteriota archaeon]